MSQTNTIVHWFRKGLRIHDNPAFNYAVEEAEKKKITLRPIFVLDHNIKNQMKISPNRIRFFHQCLLQLNNNLKNINTQLYFVRGDTGKVFERIFKEWNVNLLTFETDIEPFSVQRETIVSDIAAQFNVKIVQIVSHTLFDHNLVLSKNNGVAPITYQKFLSIAESIKVGSVVDTINSIADVRKPSKDSLEEKDHNCYMPPSLEEFGIDETTLGKCLYPGGETEGLKRLERFINNKDWICKFEKPKTSPNSLEPSTTVLSPYLKLGCVSVRVFYHKLKEIESKRSHTKPPVSLLGQIMWREFYYTAGATIPNYDKMEGNPICIQIPWQKNDEHLIAWSEGQTGYPFVDAIMRQLKEEGWIHHLARHMVACFLTRGDLWISWEEGQKVFEERLLDFDWALNAGNWLWLSASAFFHQYFRVYSPVAFGKKTDKFGEYIRKYVPELKKYPSDYIYEPWKAPISIQKTAGCVIGKDYPNRIVIHEEIHKENIAKMNLAYKKNKEIKAMKRPHE